MLGTRIVLVALSLFAGSAHAEEASYGCGFPVGFSKSGLFAHICNDDENEPRGKAELLVVDLKKDRVLARTRKLNDSKILKKYKIVSLEKKPGRVVQSASFDFGGFQYRVSVEDSPFVPAQPITYHVMLTREKSGTKEEKVLGEARAGYVYPEYTIAVSPFEDRAAVMIEDISGGELAEHTICDVFGVDLKGGKWRAKVVANPD